MVKKREESLSNNKKSIYDELKEFYHRNSGELYSYQDFEMAGIREFKNITGKILPLKYYEENRSANELLRILLDDIKNEEQLTNVKGYVTLNPIINYYKSFTKLIKEFLTVNKDTSLKLNDNVRKMIMDSHSSEVIKLGLILAPICKIENLEEILEVFSIHNDYVFYVVNAYEYIGGYNSLIFEMAKKANGYGKVFWVKNLKPMTYEIRKWMIEEGSDNIVGVFELLSYTMLSLELLDYLENTDFNENELEIFANSISLLLSEYSLDDVKDGKKVCNKLLEIINEVNGGIYSLYAVISILYSIEASIIDSYKENEGSNSLKIDNDYKNIIEKCKKICEKNFWHEVISSQIFNIEIESSVLISSAEKTKYKLKKKEFEMILNRDYINPLLYKYAFSTGNKSIKKCAFNIGLEKLPMDKILSGQDELKIQTLTYENIAQICFFIIIKYSTYEEFQDKYKAINLDALKAPLIETRIQAATNLQRFKSEFDSLDMEVINDAINTEMIGSVRRILNSLLTKTQNKEKIYVQISDNMQIDPHIKDIYLINVDIADTEYIDMSEVYNNLEQEEMLYMKREPNNLNDQNAIQIITTEGFLLGYVPKEKSLILKNLMDKGKYLYGKINEISDDYNNINIEIYLSYRDIIEEITSTLSLLSKEKETYLQ